MVKNNKFNKFLKSTMRSKDPEQVILTSEFFEILNKESQKRKVNPLLFFTNTKKYMKKIKH